MPRYGRREWTAADRKAVPRSPGKAPVTDSPRNSASSPTVSSARPPSTSADKASADKASADKASADKVTVARMLKAGRPIARDTSDRRAARRHGHSNGPVLNIARARRSVRKVPTGDSRATDRARKVHRVNKVRKDRSGNRVRKDQCSRNPACKANPARVPADSRRSWEAPVRKIPTGDSRAVLKRPARAMEVRAMEVRMDAAIAARNLMGSRTPAPMGNEPDEDLATTTLRGGPKAAIVRIWDLRARMTAGVKTAQVAKAISEGRTMVPEIKVAREIRVVPAQTDRKVKARPRVDPAVLRPVA